MNNSFLLNVLLYNCILRQYAIICLTSILTLFWFGGDKDNTYIGNNKTQPNCFYFL